MTRTGCLPILHLVMTDIFKRLVVEENFCERGITLLCQQHTFTFGDVEGQHVLLRPLEEPVDVLLNFNL